MFDLVTYARLIMPDSETSTGVASVLVASMVLMSLIAFERRKTLSPAGRRAYQAPMLTAPSPTDTVDTYPHPQQDPAYGILAALPDEVYVIDAASLEIAYLNPAASMSSGLRMEDAVGKPLNAVFDGFDLPSIQTRIGRLVAGASQTELCEVSHGDRPFEVKLALQPFPNAQPRIIAAMRDISERKRAEQEMADFVSTVSHELRSPMTSVKGALNLISSGVAGPITDRAEAMVDMAQRNVDRLLRLINDVLDLQKLDAGMMDMSLERVDVLAFCQDVIVANAGYGHEFGVGLSCSGPREPIYAAIHRDGMTQVLTNLLSNAVKFSPQGQSVELIVARHETGVRLSVTDHGIGIPPEAHDKLFARFVQAHTKIDRQRVGTGLGLNIAKTLVEKHGGNIGFTSEIGVGTTFFIDLPTEDVTLSPASP
jgi:PAS domain S-box-containing protein